MRLLLFILMLSSALPAQSVDGRVISAAGGSAIAKANVLLRNRDATAPSYSTQADANGNFHFKNVTPGVYDCAAARTGYFAQPPDRRVPILNGITMAPGQNVDGLLVRLTPLGVISGRVVDSEGHPLSNIRVEALQTGYEDGEKTLVSRRDGDTDDRGEFRLFDLFPGPYTVRANWESDGPPVRGEIRTPERDEPVSTYFPNTWESDRAAQVSVPPGAETRNIEVRLQRRPFFSIRGKLPEPSDGSYVTLRWYRRPPRNDGLPGNGRLTRQENQYSLQGLDPGRYLMVAQTPVPGRRGEWQYASSFVDVRDADLTGVDLAFAPGAELSGVLQTTGAIKPPLEKLAIVLTPVESGPDFTVPVKADGAFSLRNVLPGAYYVRVRPEAIAYPASIKAAGQELVNAKLELRPGHNPQVEIAVSADMATVTGHVVDEQGSPVAGAEVALTSDHFDFRHTSSDAAGHFLLESVSPGAYNLYAWKDPPKGASQNPEFRAPYPATKLLLTPATTTTVEAVAK